MKRSIASLVIFMSMFLSTFAGADMHPYVNSEWLTEYIYGSGFVGSSRPVWQHTSGVNFDNGFDAYIWHSLPAALNDIGNSKATEVDLCAGYRTGMLRLGASYISIFPDKEKFYGNDTLQANAQIDRAYKFYSLTIAPALRAEYNFPTNGKYLRSTTGLYFYSWVNAAYKFDDHWQATLQTKLTADMGGYSADKALMANVVPTLTYTVNSKFNVYTVVRTSLPIIESSSDPRRPHYIPGVGLTYNF